MTRQPVLTLTRDFARDQSCLNAINRRSLGTREVPVAAITGSVGRTHLATPQRLAAWTATSRYRGIVAALERGAILPSVQLYLLDGHYYILDGHHRVAASRQLGVLDIDAEVIEFLPAPEEPAAAWHRARADFERATGLIGLHIRRPDGYELARRQIAEHAWYLGERGQAPASFREAADRWYGDIYLPVTTQMVLRGLLDRCPTLTAAELYLAVCEHKWLRSAALTQDIGFARAIIDFGRPRWWAWLVRFADRLVVGSLGLLRRFGLDLAAVALPG